jgi:uncharacterized coiled-coil DUF342 family protein
MTSSDGYKGCDYEEHSKQADRIRALTSERDDYILKQKVWEEANDELRSAHIELHRQVRKLKKALNDIVALYDQEDIHMLDFLGIAERALKQD